MVKPASPSAGRKSGASAASIPEKIAVPRSASSDRINGASRVFTLRRMLEQITSAGPSNGPSASAEPWTNDVRVATSLRAALASAIGSELLVDLDTDGPSGTETHRRDREDARAAAEIEYAFTAVHVAFQQRQRRARRPVLAAAECRFRIDHDNGSIGGSGDRQPRRGHDQAAEAAGDDAVTPTRGPIHRIDGVTLHRRGK